MCSCKKDYLLSWIEGKTVLPQSTGQPPQSEFVLQGSHKSWKTEGDLLSFQEQVV